MASNKTDHVADAKQGIIDELNKKATEEIMDLLKELRAAKKVVKNVEDKIKSRKDRLVEDIKETENL